MRFASLIAGFALCAFAASSSFAHEYNVGPIHIGHPWSRVVPQGSNVVSGYMTIKNNGTTPDRLIGGSSEIAGRFQIHEMSMQNGIMKMRELAKGIEIAPGQTVKLAPGGYHLMFLDLKTPPVQGKRFKGTLEFEKAGKVDVEYAVEGMGAKGGDKHEGHVDHGKHMDHMKH